jgi:hypothetical protein
MTFSQFSLVASLVTLLMSTVADAVSVGDKAHYTLNEDRDRTSYMIKSGESDVVVESHDDAKGGYIVKVNYEVVIRPRRTKAGSIKLLVPDVVFTRGFYNDLEDRGSMEMGQFTMEHLGIIDAVDANGTEYGNCHQVRIYDIDQDAIPQTIAENMGIAVEITDLELNAKICEDLPVIGAVQLDVKGRVMGMTQKIGFDLQDN